MLAFRPKSTYSSEIDLLKQIVLNLQTVAINQFFLGNFEESLDSLNRAMGFLQLCYSLDAPQNNEQMENHLLEGELYITMANNLRYMMKDLDVEVCLNMSFKPICTINRNFLANN